MKSCLQCQPKRTLSHNLSAEIPTQFLTVEDLNEFELKMHDNSFAQKFVKQLSRVGGKSSKYMVKDLIQRLMSNDLQKKFSMIGLKGKLKFEKTLLYNVVNNEFVYRCSIKCLSGCYQLRSTNRSDEPFKICCRS
nr:uncharacterized protein LOC124815689 isoform X2 [Hydra vulgaris]